jgi:hypothetical protein
LTDSRFASGNTTDGKLKKIYIGPIAPQSFVAATSDDEDMESVLSDSDGRYDAPLNNEPFNSVPPLSTMKAVNSLSSSSSNFLPKTDRMPKTWKDEMRHEMRREMQAWIMDTIDRRLGVPISSHNRKRKNTYNFGDENELQSMATAPKQRKRLGKVEAQPSLAGKGQESTNEKSGNEASVDSLWPPHAERARFQLSPQSSIEFEQGSFS